MTNPNNPAQLPYDPAEPDTAEQTEADKLNPEWLGDCGWCGLEVNIFDHAKCTAFPGSPDFLGYKS